MPVLPDTGYEPTAEDRKSVDAWFAEYDALSAGRKVERMADMAVFPLNLVSDDSAGNGRSAQWDRAQFIETMTQVMGAAARTSLSTRYGRRSSSPPPWPSSSPTRP